MPTKVPKAGTRRSGQGIAAPALQKPIVKNFDPPRPPWLSGAGGSPSSAADTNWSQRLQRVTSKDDLEYVSEEGDCGCNSMHVCSCPRTSIVDEQLLRNYIRTSMVNEITAGEIAKGATRLALDACGALADLTGVGSAVGATCDAVNAAGYAAEGRYLLAALSVISMIPVIGDVIGKGGKVGMWLTKTFPKTSAKVVKYGPGVADKIKKLKAAIKANQQAIDKFFDKALKDERLKELHPHIPKMREALGVFMAEGMAEKELAAESVILHARLQAEATRRQFRILVSESEVIDEDEEELEEEEIDEFSGVAALGGGPSLPLGMSTPTFGRKRRKKGKEVKGWKTTHG